MEFCKACIPSRNVLICKNDKPWFTSEIRYNIRLRDRLRKLFLKSGRIFDRLSYKRQRNKVNNMKKYAKENYINNIDNIISNHDTGSSSKTFWQIMGRFMAKKTIHPQIFHIYIQEIINSPSQIKKKQMPWITSLYQFLISKKPTYRYQILTVGLSPCYLRFEFPNPKSKTS